jgi:deazaflavin-dependent oxidoreductase (nitroreductase family)
VDKRQLASGLAKYAINPLAKLAHRIGLPVGVVILETTGRKSGLPRRNPVGKSLEGDTLWIVAEHGPRANYVRNIEANPRVRVKIGRHWRTGTAHLMPDDDPRERQRRMSNKLNSAVVRVMQTDMLTVRIDLDPRNRPPGGREPSSPRSG